MSEKKIIAVVGATGSQGGGLARAILNDPDSEFAVRALTRNPGSDAARALADAGAEVVQADLDDVESLVRAFDGAYGAFCVTNFWEHFSPEKEKQQARNQAEAAKRAGLKHVVWSTLDDTRKWVPLDDDRMPTLMEHYKVPHFDAKGEANEYFENSGVPTTLFNTAFYWDNFIHFGMGPQTGEDGSRFIAFPLGDAKMPGIAAEDIGKTAYGVFKKGAPDGVEEIGISGDHVSGAEMAEGIGKALGIEVGYLALDPATYRGLGFPGAEDLGNMFQFYRDFEDDFRASRPVEATRELNPELQSFEEWVAANGKRIQVN